MYNSNLENELIIIDIADAMQDHVPIQFDIDDQKLKSAQKIAIDIELTNYMSRADIDRCIGQDENSSEADKNLFKLIVAPLCHFTYNKCLEYFQGHLSESGYTVEELGQSRAEAKNAASLALAIGNSYMDKVVEFLEAENPQTEAKKDGYENPVKCFGGEQQFTERDN